MKKLFVLITFLLAAHLGQAADKLVGGPYVVNVGPSQATVVWVLQTSVVKLGTAPSKETKAAPVLRAEKATYTELQPGTTYYYEVPGIAGAKGSFKTAPTPKDPVAFRFVAYGDTRTRHDVHQKVVNAIVKVNPDFVIHTGDMEVDGRASDLWPIFFSIERVLLSRAAFFPVLGNHEQNSSYYYQFFDVRKPYYSFNWGNSHFTMLNSEGSDSAGSPREAFWPEQRRWLENDLQRAKSADFRFVAFHTPPFSVVKGRMNAKHPVQDLVPLFEQHKAAAVFLGHDHNYQHHLKNGVRYLVVGGGGAPLYDVDTLIPGITQKAVKSENFAEVNVNGKAARVEVRAPDGTVIDAIDLK